jgi:hypothetical protein
MAAVSSSGGGWTGASLFANQSDGTMAWLAATGRTRSIIGATEGVLPAASPMVVDRTSSVVIQLLPTDMALADASMDQLANGANRALLGNEVIQFGRAQSLGNGRWRLSLLMRGRGGTESAVANHVAGEKFALLDGTPIQLDGDQLRNATSICVLGLSDSTAIQSNIACRGAAFALGHQSFHARKWGWMAVAP